MGLILDPPLDDASHRTVRGGSLEAEACARALVDEILGSNESDPSIYGVIASRLPEQAGLNALRPGPEVDAALGRLVALLVSRFGHRDTGPDHWDVVRSACRLIESDPARLQRARSVRRAAGHAESLMEVHHADLLLADSDHHSRAHGDPMRSLRQLLRSFPYLPNYVSLVEAELAGFKRLGSADRMAFCGAGALPLTAILWHLSTGIAITAVEVDPSVAHLAERVIQRLVRNGVLDAGALTVEVADAAELDAQRFQLIAVASLVPNRTLERLARSVEELGDDGPILMARSALGLTRLLAYQAIDVETIDGAGLRHLGTVAPLEQVSDDGLAQVAVERNDRLLHCATGGVLNTTEFFAVANRVERT